jgi:hypothetical protein
MNQYTVFLLLSPIVILSSLVAFIVSFRHRKGRGSIYLQGLLACSLGIIIANVLELASSSDPKYILLFSHVTYIFLAFTPVFWFVFSYQYGTGHTQSLGKLFATLSIIPLLTVAVSCTNPMHHLLWRHNEIETIGSFHVNVVFEYGPWFWGHFAYSYLLYIIGSVLVMKEFIDHFALYRHQSFLVVTAISLPLVFNLIYVSRTIPGLTKDLSPMAIAISGVLFTISMVKYHLLELNPPPRDKFCDYFDAGAVIIDGNGIIVDYNTAGAAFIGCGDIDLIGKSFYELRSACPMDIGKLTVKTIEPGPNGEVRRCIIFGPLDASPLDETDNPAASEAAPCLSTLTRREREVAELLAVDMLFPANSSFLILFQLARIA